MVAPPKKRRLPRESLSNDASPPSTPTSNVPPITLNVSLNTTKHIFGIYTAFYLQKTEHERLHQHEGCVEIVCSIVDGDSPTQTLESEAILKERAAKMKQEFSMLSSLDLSSSRTDLNSLNSMMDPRLSRDTRIFSSNTDLIGTVEKTLSILGLENATTSKPEVEATPPKRKVKVVSFCQSNIAMAKLYVYICSYQFRNTGRGKC